MSDIAIQCAVTWNVVLTPEQIKVLDHITRVRTCGCPLCPRPFTQPDGCIVVGRRGSLLVCGACADVGTLVMTPAPTSGSVLPTLADAVREDGDPCCSERCETPAMFTVFWPGKTTGMCAPCLDRAKFIAELMGFVLTAKLRTREDAATYGKRAP